MLWPNADSSGCEGSPSWKRLLGASIKDASPCEDSTMSARGEPESLPSWADRQLSRDLPTLRAKGEGQHLEYMRDFPDQTRELAKEIAAFGTSGGGLILIGVEKTGKLVGLHLGDASQRDGYLSRIQGIAGRTVNPPITPKVGFACEGERAALAIRVHKGAQPVYYCEGRPYVRHLTESRLATPEEVVQRVLNWAGVKLSDEGIRTDETSEYYWRPELDRILVDLLIAMDEMPFLSLSPGPDYLRIACEQSGASLRDLRLQYLEDEEAVAESVGALAEKCDEIAAILSRHHSGTWAVLERRCPPLRESATELRRSVVGDLPVDDEFLVEASKTIKVAARKARALVERVDKMLGSLRLDDILGEAHWIGVDMLRVTYDDLRFLDEDDRNSLREASMDLHVLQCHEQHYRASGSDAALKQRIAEQTVKLENVAASID